MLKNLVSKKAKDNSNSKILSQNKITCQFNYININKIIEILINNIKKKEDNQLNNNNYKKVKLTLNINAIK